MKTQRVLLVVALLVCLCLPSVSAADKIGALGRVGEGAESYILHFVLPAGSTISGTTATWAAADSNETLITRLSAAEKANAATPVSGTTGTFTGTFTLDDGTGASPDFIMQDATNETATFSKVDAGYLTITTVAGDGVQITTGNLRVGNGSNGQTLDGEDAYVEGLLEVDGMIYADGGVTGTLTGTATGLSGTPNITVGTISVGDGNFTVDLSGNVLMRTASYIRDADNPFCTQYYSGTNYDDNYTEFCAPETGYTETYRLYWPTAAPTGNQIMVFPAPTLGKSQGVWGDATGVGDFKADGTVPMTAAIVPNAADTIALGSAAAEWSELFLGDAAVIKGQNDQSATLTSSASLWTANNLAIDTQLKIPSSNADPTATAGYFRHDATVTNHANGAVRWHDGTNIRQMVDMVAATAEGCTDDQVASYDADNDLWYCRAVTSTEPIINIALRGGGSAISTGSAGNKRIAAAATITGYTITSSASCSIVVDLWQTTYTAYDVSTHPVNEDSITASAPITLTTAVKAKDETLTGWTKTLNADDIIHVNVDSADCTGDVDIQVYGTRSL